MQLGTHSKQSDYLSRHKEAQITEQMHIKNCTRKVKYRDEEKAAECDYFGL